jgi:putative tricarboxylic transport membrane protein
MTYIPYKGGGEVAVQLVGKHVDSTVNNPIEAVAQWRAGQLKPLCVFDAQSCRQGQDRRRAWGDIPTCKSQGLDIEYLMLRGVFMTPGATPDQVAYLRRSAQEGARDAGVEAADAATAPSTRPS